MQTNVITAEYNKLKSVFPEGTVSQKHDHVTCHINEVSREETKALIKNFDNFLMKRSGTGITIIVKNKA